MSTAEAFHLALIASGAGVALTVYWLLRSSLREILLRLVPHEAVSSFYGRILLIGLALTCVGSALDAPFTVLPKANTMDYVWQFADNLGGVLDGSALLFVGFGAMVTVLISVLERRHER